VTPAGLPEIEQFLFHEASLLDSRRYEEWLRLFTEDSRYWIPSGQADADPTGHASLVFDDWQALSVRVARLLNPAAHSQTPPSRTSHLVTNVRAEEAGDGGVKVNSTFALFEARLGVQRCFGGQCAHLLRRLEGHWRIASKTVVLVNSDGFQHNLTFMF